MEAECDEPLVAAVLRGAQSWRVTRQLRTPRVEQGFDPHNVYRPVSAH